MRNRLKRVKVAQKKSKKRKNVGRGEPNFLQHAHHVKKRPQNRGNVSIDGKRLHGLGASLRGRTATHRSEKGSGKVLGRVLGKGSQKGSEKGACCGF